MNAALTKMWGYIQDNHAYSRAIRNPKIDKINQYLNNKDLYTKFYEDSSDVEPTPLKVSPTKRIEAGVYYLYIDGAKYYIVKVYEEATMMRHSDSLACPPRWFAYRASDDETLELEKDDKGRIKDVWGCGLNMIGDQHETKKRAIQALRNKLFERKNK